VTSPPHTTDPSFRVERRHNTAKRVLIWTLAPFVDEWNGLSLNRFLAILFGVAATHGRFVHDTALTGWDMGFAIVAGSLAFGKDTWAAYLNRKNGA
jgi:hypothetical protein